MYQSILRKLESSQELLYLSAHTTQVFGGGHDVNVDNAPDLVMVHFRGRVDRFDVGDRFEWRVLGRGRGTQRDVSEVRQRHILNLFVRILHRQGVVVTRLRIDPIARGDHAIRRQRSNHVVDYVLGSQAEQASLFAVDV